MFQYSHNGFPAHRIITWSLALFVLIIAGCTDRNRPSASIDPKAAAIATEQQLAACPSSALQVAADTLYQEPSYKDKACAIYNMIAMRYKTDREDAKSGIHANLKLWERYMFDFHDLSTAMEYLNLAADISESEHIPTAEVDYAYAICYQNMGNHTREQELYRKSLDFYEAALNKIPDTGEYSLYDRLIPNYLTLLYSMNEPMGRSSRHIDLYIGMYSDSVSANRRHYIKTLYRGLDALQSQRFDEAASHFSNMRRYIDSSSGKYMSILNEATALQRSGRVKEALKVLDKADSLLKAEENPEMLVSINFTRSKYWEMLGDTSNSHHFYILYCQARDSLLSYRQMSSLHKAEFSQSIMRLDRKLIEMEYWGKIKTAAITVSLLIMLLLSGAAVIIIRKNRELKRSNRALYEHNKEILAIEKRERAERERYAAMLESNRKYTDNHGDPTPKADKYSSRKLTDDIKNEIHDLVLDAMENSQKLYDSDFSLGQLSKICGSPQEYVSQVINETFGCNFNELVNKYRIREACRRISDRENYSQFTLAAIAAGVGIDSPTTFSKYFKKVTGLTPSQYKKNSDAEHGG